MPRRNIPEVKVGDIILWMKRTAPVEVTEVEDGFVTTKGKPGVSWLQAPIQSVRCVVRSAHAKVRHIPA
jgi:hypothetical protein